MEAYNLYLKGHYQLHKYTAESFEKSKEYFEQAIAMDPDYALAWFGLAETDWYLGFLGVTRPREANSSASHALLKALELDETLPEAHAMMAILRFSEFDWKRSEDEFLRALELGPQSPFVWWTYSLFYLTPMRRLDEAIVAATKALEIDPLSALLQWQLGHRYFHKEQYGPNEQYSLAIKHFRNALELDPQYCQAYLMLGVSRILEGKLEEGIQACETGVRIGGRIPLNLTILGSAFLLAGRVDDGKRILGEMHELAARTYVSPMALAYFYILLGEMDKAFDWVEKAVDEHDGMIMNVLASRIFADPLRSHPRYHALLRKMNLEP
jgi:tetratricopeptide (TPR) repeat protein